MRWMGGRRSSNVEDRRGQSAGGGLGGGGFPGGFGGGGGGRRIGIGGGIGGVVVIVILLLLGVDPSELLQGGGSYAPIERPQSGSTQQAQDQQAPRFWQPSVSLFIVLFRSFPQRDRQYQLCGLPRCYINVQRFPRSWRPLIVSEERPEAHCRHGQGKLSGG